MPGGVSSTDQGQTAAVSRQGLGDGLSLHLPPEARKAWFLDVAACAWLVWHLRPFALATTFCKAPARAQRTLAFYSQADMLVECQGGCLSVQLLICAWAPSFPLAAVPHLDSDSERPPLGYVHTLSTIFMCGAPHTSTRPTL